MHRLVEAWTRSLSTDEAVERLERAAACGRVRDPGQAVRDPRLLARGETEAIEHP